MAHGVVTLFRYIANIVTRYVASYWKLWFLTVMHFL